MSSVLNDRQVDAMHLRHGGCLPYKGVVFDFDGTLADSFPWFLGAVNQLARQHRFAEISLADVDVLRRMSGSQIMAKLNISPWRVPLIGRDLRRLMESSIGDIHLFTGLDQHLLRMADHGVRLAIVSSNSIGNVRAVLGEAVASRVEHFECGAALLGKSARLRRIMRRWEVRAEEMLFIGDEIRDVQAAKVAGVASGAVTWGYNDAESLLREMPDRLFECASDLSALLPAGALSI